MEAQWARGRSKGSPPAGTPRQRGQQLPCSVSWSGQDRGGHRSRAQLTWPACRRCRVSDFSLGWVPQRQCAQPAPQPPRRLPAVPDSDTARSCLRAPQTPPHPGAPGPERSTLWATCFLVGCGATSPCPTSGLAEGKEEGRAGPGPGCGEELTVAHGAEAGAWRGVRAEGWWAWLLPAAHGAFLGREIDHSATS